MRHSPYARWSHSEITIPWKWISIVWAIILILIAVRLLWSSDTAESSDYLTVTPWQESSVYISMTSASKSRITSEQKLFASDKSVSVEQWNAIAYNESISIDIDKWTEISYMASSSTGNIIAITKWRAWIKDITKPLRIDMKNYSVLAPTWSVVLIEQNGPYSNAYTIIGTIKIETSIDTIEITGWNSISLLKSDLINPSTKLSDWVRPIEWSIIEYPLFIRNEGATLMQSNNITSQSTQSGSIEITNWSWSTQYWKTDQYIEVTEPKVWILSKGNSITVMWNVLSKDVKRVTINNVDAIVSPVNETFVLQNMAITSEIFDIVYKAYDSNWSLLQTGVISIFWNKNTITTNTNLIPETFPVATKDFRITAPSWNPYSTTERFIRVQWTVPKNTVDYIVVNDYRLQKFIPKSGTWYYFANMDTGTMAEWLNLYNIKFYRQDGTLLYTQPFTIIKESKNATISGA